jgi:hypothetical protein
MCSVSLFPSCIKRLEWTNKYTWIYERNFIVVIAYKFRLLVWLSLGL